jgi:hypothetical protein
MSVSDMTLDRGRQALAEHLKRPERSLARWLAELRNKGFIALEKRAGRPTRIHILTRAVLVGVDRFVKFT